MRAPALALLASLFLACPPVGAEEPAPQKAPGALDKEIAAARALQKDGNWMAARDAFLKLFEDHPRDPEILRRLPDIEEDLKLCSFRAQEPEPTAQDLFGKGADSFSPTSRRVYLTFGSGPQCPPWVGPETGLSCLRIRFEEVIVDFSGTLRDDTLVLVSYDPDTSCAYVVDPGFAPGGQVTTARILRMDGDKFTELCQGPGCPSGVASFKVTRTPRRISCALDDLKPMSATDSRLKSGFLAVKNAGGARLGIQGVVDKTQAQAIMASHYDRRYREWSTRSWRREQVLPEWAASAPAVSGPKTAMAPLPTDAPAPLPEALVRALDHWSRGEVKEFLQSLPPADDLRAVTRHYLQGLAALGEGRLADAERLLSGAVEGEAAFAPALVYRAFTRFRLRDMPGTRSDLEKALEAGASIPDVWVALACVAISDGHLEKADEVLAGARERGVASPVLDLLAKRVIRSRRGPAWAKRYEVKAAATLVATDHSQDMAQKVSRVVEGTLSLGTSVFPDTVRASAPIRVSVFSDREGFFTYCTEMGQRVSQAVGIYIPSVRELVLYLPDVSREELWNTVRHEAFHAFLHASLEEAPTWFNEGWAACFGSGKAVAGGIRLADPDPAPLREHFEGGVSRTALEELMLMDPETFHARSPRNHALSQALVQYLQESTRPPYRVTLREYFQSLRAGLSQKEAYEKHWKPVLLDVSTGFSQWLIPKQYPK